MQAFRANHYVPVLTWKGGEQLALASIPEATRQQMTPLIEIAPIPVDLETGDPTKTLEDHIDASIEKLVATWPDRFCFLDPAEVAHDGSADGHAAAAYVYGQAAARGVSFIPVLGLKRSTAENAAALAHRSNGMCLRLSVEDLENPILPLSISLFMRSLELQAPEVDLVVDLESIAGLKPFVVTSMAEAQIKRVPNPSGWRTLTLLASSFPSNLGGIQGTSLIERVEWQAWRALYEARASLPRLPTFGDYVIDSPAELEGYDPRYMPMSPAIRYTLEKQWLIVRGMSSKKILMSVQYPSLAATLVQNQPPYYGIDHCKGCSDAHGCASGEPRFGSPQVWRRIGTIHHITVAAEQLSGVAAP